MRFCAAFSCTNGSKTKENKEYIKTNNITFHGFPMSDKKRLKAWIDRVGRKDFAPTRHSCLCSQHFREEDFTFQPFTNMRLLKKTAVPSRFSHTKASDGEKRRKTTYEFGASVVIPVAKTQAQETQTDLTYADIDKLYQTQEELQIKCSHLETANDIFEQKAKQPKQFTIESLSSANVKRATGFTPSSLNTIFNFFNLQFVLSKGQNTALSPFNIFFMTLLRLRQGLSESMLALLFDVSIGTISRHLNDCLDAMYHKGKNISIWPSKHTIQSFMPLHFKMFYPSCRVIIDCTEFFVQKPSKPELQQTSWSNYKNHNTYKSLIGIAPSGAVNFISDLWFGSVSDKELTLKCGLMDKLEQGDLVLADRGFTVLESEFEKRGVRLETPFFLSNKKQFELDERSENKRISHHRVHVERAIGRIKNFQILNGIIPASLKSINKIHFICAFLTNFSEEPLIQSHKIHSASTDSTA